jgi:hypothetical protein
VATATKIYTSYSPGWAGDWQEPGVRHASINADSIWTDEAVPSGLTEGGFRSAVAFDGTHYVIISADWSAGVWRYIEPVSGTQALPSVNRLHTNAPARVTLSANLHGNIHSASVTDAHSARFYDVKGMSVNQGRAGSQIIIKVK